MHVKDSGTVLLTEHDLLEHALGKVSERVKNTWGFTYEEMVEVIKSNHYRIITKDDTDVRTIKNSGGETSDLSTQERSGTGREDGAED